MSHLLGRGPHPVRRLRRSLTAFVLAIAVGAVTIGTSPDANANSLNGCGLLKLQPCSGGGKKPAARVPGAAVAQLTQVNQSRNGGTNPKVGTTPSTAKLGVPNPGVVPVLGNVAAVADDGAYVAYESRVDARTVDLMVVSPALGGAAPVRVLLPTNWTSQPATTWPVLYLLHGGNDKTDYQSWTWDTNVVKYVANTPAMVVMPSLGSLAFASNYVNGSGNQYDTFMSAEIPQLMQRGYHASTRAAIAGISSGGYSAMALAMLHASEFSAAASYSGTPDTELSNISQSIELGPLLEGQAPYAMWGMELLNRSVWDARNPTTQANHLRGVGLFVSSGNGTAGPLDAGAASDQLEPMSLASSQSFVAKLNSLIIPVTTDFYTGTHSWKYWDREFQRSLPVLLTGLGLKH